MFVNLFMLVLSINCEIQAITSAKLSLSATTEAVNRIEINKASTTEGPDILRVAAHSSSTEGLDILRDTGKISTENPVDSEIPEIPPTPLTLDDFDRQLKDIFTVTDPTSTPFPLDEFSSEEMEISNENGETLSLGRRTNFKTRRNCRCIIRNRCARSDSCLKEAKKK